MLLFLRSPAIASPPEPSTPSGFHLVHSATGVQLYQKDYSEGNPDFVQIVDLSQGAAVEVLHGEITETRAEKGAYGGNDARFELKSLESFWQELASASGAAFCVTNGQFFYMPEAPTRLPFSLKKDGIILTDGYAIDEFRGKKLMMEIWPGQVDIRELDQANLYNSTAPDIIAGLSEEANKRSKKHVGRTFTGIADRNGDGWAETVLIFNTLTARQTDAAAVLRSFGAVEVMMLDGGGSTQLICKGETLIDSDRFIPQAIGVFAGPEPTPTPAPTAPVDLTPTLILSATVSVAPGWQTLLVGETSRIEIQMTNSGTQPWKAGEVQLVIEPGAWGESEVLPLHASAGPGDEQQLTWVTGPLSVAGVYEARAYLEHTEKTILGEPAHIRLVAVPVELKDRRGELESKMALWSVQESDHMEQLVVDWIRDQEPPLAAGLLGVFLVPVIILPLAGFLVLFVIRNR
jgi:hypothetical protein